MADHNYGSAANGVWTCGNCGKKWTPKKPGRVVLEKVGFILAFEYNAAHCPNCKQIVLDKGSETETIGYV